MLRSSPKRLTKTPYHLLYLFLPLHSLFYKSYVVLAFKGPALLRTKSRESESHALTHTQHNNDENAATIIM